MRILLDPSCSGSGTTFSKADPAELAVFVANQEALLRHALSFPSVLRVVYSTCRLGSGLGLGLANPNPSPNPNPNPNPNPYPNSNPNPNPNPQGSSTKQRKRRRGQS